MIALIRRILGTSGKYKSRIKWAFVFSFLKGMMMKAPIMLSFLAITRFMAGTADAAFCGTLAAGMAVSLLLCVFFQHLADRLQAGAGFELFADKRMELGTHLRKMPMGYFTEGNIGRISSVLSSDMGFIEQNCMMVLADLMSYIFAEFIMVAFLFYLSPWMGLGALVILVFFLLVGKGMKKEAMEDSVKRQEQNGNLTDAVLDYIEGMGITKTYNLLGKRSKELTDNFDRMCSVSIDFEEAAAPWQRRMNLVYGLGTAAALALCLVLYMQGLLTASYLIGVMLFLFDLFNPIRMLYSQSTRLTVMSAALDRVENLFGEQELLDTGTARIPAAADAPEIEFKHVSFAYGDKEVLHDVSFSLPRNQMFALVGPSGGGKSTIANLLARFWDVNDGQVLIRGRDVREIPLSELMNHISMVFQRVYLFQDTIYNNISMGRPDATRKEVIEAAKKARCYDFIMALPNGFDTMVGEGGESLSGGEKQRISIARCILKDAPIVILDEATASVDADNESYIQQAISELCRGKTLLVIAHRLGTIQNADQILVVSGGGIAQSGSHDELIGTDGIYRTFVNVRQNSLGWSRQV
ncbi:ABC transporter ATP-binding protein [Diplocloster modestus]|uniref:ABC transporter ATP-binding protein/permease n=1 Tax=Diplocloster modestus TaxID=2850322 RepID=A0ABS6K7W0_9FIRM|nr:ABC transporter ATP-binding protein [Diplocloster modestus]MBU9726599.1 ABC transporter ATP-binding protein/permease [Diplocloster modestus]